MRAEITKGRILSVVCVLGFFVNFFSGESFANPGIVTFYCICRFGTRIVLMLEDNDTINDLVACWIRTKRERMLVCMMNNLGSKW